MMVLVTYDVATPEDGSKGRLARIAKILKNKGQRVQNSVFECLVDPAQWVELKSELESTIDPSKDSLRYYFLGKNWKRRIEHVGAKPTYDVSGPLIL